ncbi:ClbS/DfsB family four-helix bundle protein [uncultured Shimia sp.]|uniref:ClbS/DfsB family four-helix bundle protein n=1 Tax=uncultured Shimia sp. TaxID=573152 RepID=UPI002625EADB|nr:ClbS/DfsB family four-helix bundle protein [uncultured Shimia sp.]
MPAATNKADLLAITAKEYSKLTLLLDPLDPVLVERPFEDGWSIRDVIVHRAHWIDLFLGWYHDGQAGKEVAFPAPGYKWNQLKAYNADLLAQKSDVTWPEARAALEKAHQTLTSFLETLDDAALYGEPMKGANNKWTRGAGLKPQVHRTIGRPPSL